MDRHRGDVRAANRVRAAWAPLMKGVQQPMAKDKDETPTQPPPEPQAGAEGQPQPEPQPEPADDAGDAGQAEVQEAADRETDQGFLGIKADPTPNEAYTLSGVTGGQPTPETDPALRREARAHADAVGERMTNPKGQTL